MTIGAGLGVDAGGRLGRVACNWLLSALRDAKNSAND